MQNQIINYETIKFNITNSVDRNIRLRYFHYSEKLKTKFFGYPSSTHILIPKPLFFFELEKFVHSVTRRHIA